MVSGEASWRIWALSRKVRPALPLTICSKLRRESFGERV
jgi:hypothetical protein